MIKITKEKSGDPVERYMREIDRLFPYSQKIKEPILAKLRKDVQDALQSDPRIPSLVYGSPKKIALKISREQDWETEPAEWFKRILAAWIDFALLSIILLIFFLSFLNVYIYPLYLFLFSYFNPLFTLLERPEGLETFSYIFLTLFLGVPTLLLIFGYFIFFETYFSKTIGKKIFGLTVVQETGIKINFSQGFIRNFTKIPYTGQILIFDFLIGLFSKKTRLKNQRVFDLVSETLVVQTKKKS